MRRSRKPLRVVRLVEGSNPSLSAPSSQKRRFSREFGTDVPSLLPGERICPCVFVSYVRGLRRDAACSAARSRQKPQRPGFEWSYDLLDPSERTLFRRLGVFVGGFTFEAATAVCDGDLDGLESLVIKSLLVGGDERFSLLETIHEYAREQLEQSSEAEDVHRRHAVYFVSVAESAEAEDEGEHDPLQGTEYRQFLNRVAAEYDNFRSALAWAIRRNDRELSLRLATATPLRTVGPVVEARRVFEAALAVEGRSAAQDGSTCAATGRRRLCARRRRRAKRDAPRGEPRAVSRHRRSPTRRVHDSRARARCGRGGRHGAGAATLPVRDRTFSRALLARPNRCSPESGDAGA